MAAGFTIKAENLEEFRSRLNRYAQDVFGEESIGRTLMADAEIKLEEITPAFIQSLARLEPHGIGNAAPVFLLRDVPVRSIQLLKEKHLKLSVGTQKKNLEAVWWQAAQHQTALASASDISLLCRPEVNEWKGRASLQLKVVDVAI